MTDGQVDSIGSIPRIAGAAAGDCDCDILNIPFTCDFRNRRLQIFADNGTCDIIEDRPATGTCGGTFSLKTATCDFQTGDFNKSPISAPATIYETNRRPAPAAAPWFENRYLRLLNRHLRQRCL